MADQEAQSPPHSELATFGEDLRREREIRGISLKEIADATKISKRFLEAIERNDHKTLPAPVFTRGFVREYARYLGLNAEDMVSRYNHAAAGDDRIEKTPQLDRLVMPPPESLPPPQKRRGIPPVYARIDRNLIILVIIAAALATVTWWAVQRRRAPERPVETTAVAVIAPATPPAGSPETASQADEKLVMEVEVLANSWVVLEADGKVVFSDELKRGDRRTFEATENFRFRTVGNAAGLQLTLNGMKLPALGSEGEVVKNKTFDRDELQELRSNQPRTES